MTRSGMIGFISTSNRSYFTIPSLCVNHVAESAYDYTENMDVYTECARALPVAAPLSMCSASGT